MSGTSLGHVAASLSAAIHHATRDQVDAILKQVWQANFAGSLSDEEAQALAELANAKQRTARGPVQPVGVSTVRAATIFRPRQRPRSPNRKASRERRRLLGGSGAMPDKIRVLYTEGQRAVLFVVSGEIKRRGYCDLPIDKIAALAGVSRTTVQTTMHEARRLGHIRITARPQAGRKNLSNVVEIISPEWLTWLQRGAAAHPSIGSSLLTRPEKVSPTKKHNIIDTTKRLTILPSVGGMEVGYVGYRARR